MMEIRKTEVYARWLDGLRDIRARAKQQGRELSFLLSGGDKGSQARDIKAALRLARNL